ncbi:iron complex transport system substrate-binding protein [Brevibacterium siliguriense]|uniref:Iron complex transport system substrate-binding protein n=1 Tax=Brevibacterium siliguriense TaxID=1136497 RepID=A0A1H1MFP0_9MICO|nr:ABC transporter substrate-binding protein [Brevibacterium siliguriense]SDR85422.1 iron complex transport system substrate-binding protein [Brevibacterium siliguriense]
MSLTRLTAAAIAGATGLALFAGCAGGSEETSPGTASETRTVTDATGAEVEVPTAPKAVATLHYAATETLMDLDAPPVAQGEYQDPAVPEEWLDELEKIPAVSQQEPDLEKLAETEPDLILSPNIFEPDMIEQLEEIAPVYQFTLRGGDRANWQQRVEEVADAVNRTDDLDELDSEFQARQKKLGEKYSEVTEGTTIGVVSSFEENSAYLWGSENMLGTILSPLGFDWSADEDAMVKKYGKAEQGGNKSGTVEPEAQISLEVLDRSLSDADIIFVNSDLRGDYDSLTKALLDSAVFKDLPAVKAGHVYPIGKATIAGYADADYGLDLAEKAITEYQKD